ncbi:hypothetical protein [Hutsoniella sourekii]|uniref:hypothetical protein n=1 Tax=Hutsoniella sourekii TaxID=87650 RepID=UPI00048277B1|nr:hypothetical protein [Hutsoniella sourekii]
MNKRDLLIDLTPLLDVILILLFMVLMNQNQVHQEEVSQLENQLENLQSSQTPLSNAEKNWQTAYRESIGKVSIVYRLTSGNPHYEMITEDQSTLSLNSFEEMKQELISLIAKMETTVIIVNLTYNPDQIYYQEFQKVQQLMTRLSDITNKTIIVNQERI